MFCGAVENLRQALKDTAYAYLETLAETVDTPTLEALSGINERTPLNVLFTDLDSASESTVKAIFTFMRSHNTSKGSAAASRPETPPLQERHHDVLNYSIDEWDECRLLPADDRQSEPP